MRSVLRLAVAAIALCLARAGSAVDGLMSASSRDHGWFIVDRSASEPRFTLHHYARVMEGPHYNKGLPLSRMPEAMAAWGNQLWLIFDSGQRREVFTVQVHRNELLDAWQYQPADRLRAVTQLDTPGELIDAAGTSDGPLVLLRPWQRARVGVRAADGSVAAEPALDRPRLMLLDGRVWRDEPLPGGFEPGPRCRLVSGGPLGRRILLLDGSNDPGMTAAYWRDAESTWTRTDVRVPPGRLLAVTSVGPAIALVLRGGEPDLVEVDYLRPWQLLPLARFDRPAGAWAVLGLAAGMVLVELSPQRELSMRRIDAVTGRVGDAHPMVAEPVLASRVLHRPLLFALAVTALMFVLLFRPEPGAAAMLPSTQALMRPLPRLLAVGVDLVVAAALTLVILRCPAADLLDQPLWSPDLARTVPFLVTAGITVLHSTLAELATGRTLGKAMLGGRVVKLDGSRPAAPAILIRNAFKLLVLLIPVLAVGPLLNPNAQGLGDNVAGTVVVTGARRSAEPGPDDR